MHTHYTLATLDPRTRAIERVIRGTFWSLDEATEEAEQRARTTRRDIVIRWHDTFPNGREVIEIAATVPYVRRRKLPIHAFLAECEAKGMTIEEAAAAWTARTA